MTLRKQIEALYRKEPWPQFVTAGSMAEAARTANNNVVDDVLDIIDAHECYQDGLNEAAHASADEWGDHVCIPDRDALAAALATVMQERGGPIEWPDNADAIIAAMEIQE